MQLSLQPDKHRLIFFFGLLLIACGLSLGAFPLSLGQLIIGANWLWEGNFKWKWQRIKDQKIFFVFAAFFLLHVLGLAWSTDYEYGINDIKIKAPLFALPLIFATTVPLTVKELNTLLKVYAFSVIASTLWSMVYFTGLRELPPNDIRKLSRFYSHIRFSMNIVYAFFISAWFVYTDRRIQNRVLWIVVAIWLLIFLFILSSLTGILILFILLAIYIFRIVIRQSNSWIKFSLIAITIIAVWFALNRLQKTYNSYFSLKEDFEMTDSKSASGSGYWRDTSMQRENGYLIWKYIAITELENEWNKKSDIHFDGKDKKGTAIRFTLIRYLTSKGLRKDSVGVNELTAKDIESIENGIPNYRLSVSSPLKKRIYDLMWEIYDYRENGAVKNRSLVLKMVYWKTGWKIAQNNLLFGVGTGDVQLAFNEQYDKDNSVLKTDEERKRAHNQYLTILIALGIPGLIVMLAMMFVPLANLKNSHALFFPVYWILFFSMFSEDTLETQAGVTMFAFFFSLFIFLVGKRKKSDQSSL